MHFSTYSLEFVNTDKSPIFVGSVDYQHLTLDLFCLHCTILFLAHVNTDQIFTLSSSKSILTDDLGEKEAWRPTHFS